MYNFVPTTDPHPTPSDKRMQMKEEADYQPPTEKMRSVPDSIHSHTTTEKNQDPLEEDHSALCAHVASVSLSRPDEQEMPRKQNILLGSIHFLQTLLLTGVLTFPFNVNIL